MKPTGATKEATVNEFPNATPRPWRVVIDDTGDPITGGYPSICAAESLDTTIIHVEGFHHEFWYSHPGILSQVANAQLIVTAVNERERLRAAIQKFVDAYSNGKEARLGNGQARRSLDEFRQLLNDSHATPSTSAGGG